MNEITVNSPRVDDSKTIDPTNGATTNGAKSTPSVESLTLVAVTGTKHFNRGYAQSCIRTWSRIGGVVQRCLVDDGLTADDVRQAHDEGFDVYDRQPELVMDALADKPALQRMRRHAPTWRHVTDSVILCRKSDYIVLIDTDVFVLEPIVFADQGLDYVYNCDDVPAYRGTWYLPFVQPMVPAINPGFMLLRPGAVDLDLLEHLAARYLVDQRNYWWTRQSALAVLVGRSERRGLFDGNDVRVFAGNLKRTATQIRRNVWRVRGSNRLLTDPARADECIQGAAVVHFANKGKDWIDVAEGHSREAGPPRVLRASDAPLARHVERLAIAFRMFASR